MELANKFVPKRSLDVTSLVCDRLAHMERFEKAGDLMLSVKNIKEALDMYMSAAAWDKARDIARNIAPRYVDM